MHIYNSIEDFRNVIFCNPSGTMQRLPRREYLFAMTPSYSTVYKSVAVLPRHCEARSNLHDK